MKTVIVSLVKNKTGDTSDVNNYRPIALVTIASKIFENIMLEILQRYLIFIHAIINSVLKKVIQLIIVFSLLKTSYRLLPQ